MLLIRGRHNLKDVHRGCVATIGNFDGVHLGHQAVFAALREYGKRLALPSVVITFEPQPLEYFRPDQAPARLTRLHEKLGLIADSGIDRVLLLKFDHRLAGMPATEFVERILVEGLGVKHLYVGDDFRFGKGREGDHALLAAMGERHGFDLESMPTVECGDGRISSTRIRDALMAGRLDEAERCLGRRFTLCGRVAHGHKLGRTIGFPTLNISLQRRQCPVRGVFAVTVEGLGDTPLPGVANVGNRPTLEGDDRFLLEVYLYDFARDVYGCRVVVNFVERIRDERKFDSFDAMRVEIERDAEIARSIHGLMTTV